MANFPGMLVLGYLDIDRNFLASIEMADKAMFCQIIAPLIHGCVCYYLTITIEWGVTGTGFASFITNSIIFLIQNYYLRHIKEMKESNDIRLLDQRNWSVPGFKSYLKLALPSFIFLSIDWSV